MRISPLPGFCLCVALFFPATIRSAEPRTPSCFAESAARWESVEEYGLRIGSSNACAAQERADSVKAQRKLTDTQKMVLYSSLEKSEGVAMLWSLVITSGGHAYAKNWPRGLLFSAGRVLFGVLAITQGIDEDVRCDDDGWYYYCTTKTELTEMYYVGLIGICLVAVAEAIDAMKEVERYNKKTYDRIFVDASN